MVEQIMNVGEDGSRLKNDKLRLKKLFNKRCDSIFWYYKYIYILIY